MIDEPQRDLRDLGREVLDLDAVELINIEREFLMDIQETGSRPAVYGAQDFEFEQAQLAVGDDEEVAAAAGWVEEDE